MSIWIFLLWIALGIAAATLVVRRARRSEAPARALRKRLRYLKPYTPAPTPPTQGAPCD